MSTSKDNENIVRKGKKGCIYKDTHVSHIQTAHIGVPFLEVLVIFFEPSNIKISCDILRF